MTQRIERRRLLVASSAATLGALTGCKRSDTCPAEQVNKLSAEDKKVRDTLQYTDRSPDPQKVCNRCQQYLPSDADCGGCKLLKGPIHPDGYCTAFVAKG